MSAQVRSRRAFTVVLLSVLALLALPRAARTEPLGLSPTAAAECPDCETATGGAQAINYFEQLAPQEDVTLTPPDGAAPPPDGWNASAQTMVADEGANTAAEDTAGEAADVVSSESIVVEEAAGSVPELCGTAVLCPAALGVGAFMTGYSIGTGAKALYLRLFGGDAPDTDPNIISNVTWKSWAGPGDYRIASDTGPVVHPGEWYLEWAEQNPFGYNFFNYAWHGATTGNQCRFGLPQPHFVIVRSGTTPNRCSSDPPQPIEAYVRTPEMFVSHRYPPQPAGSPGPSGTTSVPAPATPSRSDFADAARHVLDDPSSRSLRLWLEHELSPRCHADPTRDTVNVPEPLDGESETSFENCLTTLGLVPTAIELSDADLDADYGNPVFSDPGYEASADPGTEVRVYRNPPETRADTHFDRRCRPDGSGPTGDPGDSPPGYVGAYPDLQRRPLPAPEGYPGEDVLRSTYRTIRLLWGTEYWGYRHIAIKRGYGPEDEADTAEALQDPTPIPEADNDSSWRFQAFYNVIDAVTGAPVHCVRTVVVNFFQRDLEPYPRDIITSFYGSYDS
jgi:hypothetical protein